MKWDGAVAVTSRAVVYRLFQKTVILPPNPVGFRLTLKGPGFFVYLKSGGGGGGGADSAPPSDLGRGATKILKFGTYVELVNTNVLTKFQYLKSKHFWIMQIYVNYMHVFLFLTITDKIRPFGALKLFWYCRRNIEHIPE